MAVLADRQCRVLRKLLLTAALLMVGLAGTVGGLYLLNAAPTMPVLTTAEAARSTRPLVVKLHARWCPYCLMTKDDWGRVEEAYRGRVDFVVLDFTTAASTERSRAEAERLNLRGFFDEYVGATGMVVVLDGVTREVRTELGGNRSFEDYSLAINDAIRRAAS